MAAGELLALGAKRWSIPCSCDHTIGLGPPLPTLTAIISPPTTTTCTPHTVSRFKRFWWMPISPRPPPCTPLALPSPPPRPARPSPSHSLPSSDPALRLFQRINSAHQIPALQQLQPPRQYSRTNVRRKRIDQLAQKASSTHLHLPDTKSTPQPNHRRQRYRKSQSYGYPEPEIPIPRARDNGTQRQNYRCP